MSKIEHVPIDRLVCRPQVRERTGFDEESLAGLAQSISAAGGILQPLLVRREGDKLVVLDGERRLRAAKLAGLTSVPVIVDESPMSDGEVVYRQLVLDAQRVELSPMERARAIQRLMTATNWSDRELAAKLGVSPATVSKLLALTVLPADVQAQVASGRLAMSAAYELVKIADPAERERLAAEAVSGKLNRDTVAKRAKEISNAKAAGKPRRRYQRKYSERIVMPLGSGRSVAVSGDQLSVESVVAWLTELLERIRMIAVTRPVLVDVVKALADERK